MASFYIACTLSRWRDHNELRDALVAAGHELTHDWTTSPEIDWIKQEEPGVGGDDARNRVDVIRQAGIDDIEGVRNADAVICLLAEGSAQRGMHTELGAALVLGRPVLLYGSWSAIWEAYGYTSAFYHHPGVEIVYAVGAGGPLASPEVSWAAFLHDAATWLNAAELNTAAATPLTIDAMTRESFRTAVEKGWWGEHPANLAEDRSVSLARIASGIAEADHKIGEKLMLIVTEVAEAMEEYRNGVDLTEILMDADGKPGKPGGFPSELADVLIRIGDLCGALGIDLEEAVRLKLVYNKGRSYRHGGKKA